MFHKQIFPSTDPEAIVVQSTEMETDQTHPLGPENVFIAPPVCTSQSLAVLSSLPDTSKVPSGEKVRQFTSPVCPERTAFWLPVITLRIMIFLGLAPTAIMLFRNERVGV